MIPKWIPLLLFSCDSRRAQNLQAEADKKNREFDFAADKIESVILTHAHFDHCGLLPVLMKNGYRGNIYATPATRDLANIVMMDSARIQARDAEFLAKQARKKGEKFSTPVCGNPGEGSPGAAYGEKSPRSVFPFPRERWEN